MLVVALWLFGFWARPDFWEGLDNSFSILLAFSEIALLAVGLTFVMANGDIDLSVGSVLALSGATAAVIMKDTESRSVCRRRHRHRRWRAGRRDQRLADRLCRPSRLHRDSGHLLLGARHRIVDRGRHAAQRLSRILQPHRPQPVRIARRARNGADPRTGGWRSPRRSACRRSSSSSWRRLPESCSPTRGSGRRCWRSAAMSARRASPASTRAASASPRC